MISDKQHDTYPATARSGRRPVNEENGRDAHPSWTPRDAQSRHASPRPPARDDAGELLARLESLAAKVSALEQDNVRLRAEMRLPHATATAAREAPDGESSRRSFLRRGTMLAVAGLGAGVVTSRAGVPGAQAAAAPIQSITAGSSGPNTSGVQTTGTYGAMGLRSNTDSGDAVFATSDTGNAMHARSGPGSPQAALFEGGNGTGVAALGGGAALPTAGGGSGVIGASAAGGSAAGVTGSGSNGTPGVSGASDTGTGVSGASASGYGGSFQCGAGGAQLFLAPAAAGGWPAIGTHYAGELFVDVRGTIYFCSADGTPGIWNEITMIQMQQEMK